MPAAAAATSAAQHCETPAEVQEERGDQKQPCAQVSGGTSQVLSL